MNIKIEITKQPYIINIFNNNDYLKSLYFENAIDFKATINKLLNMSDLEILETFKNNR